MTGRQCKVIHPDQFKHVYLEGRTIDIRKIPTNKLRNYRPIGTRIAHRLDSRVSGPESRVS